MQAVRASYDPHWLAQSSQMVSERLAGWEVFQKANCVMGYLAFGNEVNIDWLLTEALRCGKRVLIPWLPEDGQTMEAVEFSGMGSIVSGKFNIRTVAAPLKKAQIEDIGLVLTPGLAFTKHGERMGLGRGYYDHFFARSGQAVTIGVTLSPQVVDSLPTEPHDKKVNFLVTEYAIIICQK